MVNSKKLLTGFVLMLTIGVGTAFAGWSSSATGSCTCGDTTFYPWSNWTQPEYGGTPENPHYDTISGSWDDGTYTGRYYGVKDSISGYVPEEQYKWYSGYWSVSPEPELEVMGGNFWLRVQLNIGPGSIWNGEWWDIEPPFCPCTGGTMTGTYYPGPDPQK